jgi:hypothetical protein
MARRKGGVAAVVLVLLTLPWLFVTILVVAACQASSKADRMLDPEDPEDALPMIRAYRGPGSRVR